VSLIPYNFDGQPVRTIINDDGNPWFVHADACRVLDITNSGNAAARLDSDEKGVHSMDTLGGRQELTIISESGLYSLILTSRKPEAKRFKRWITSEVIPSIRKTGRYGAADPMVALSDPATMRALLLGYTEKVIALEGRVSELQPKVAAFDLIANLDGSLCITDAAKTLHVKPKVLFHFLRTKKWIYRRGGQGAEIAYGDKLQFGYLEHKITTVNRSDGTERSATQVRVTPAGLSKIAIWFHEQPELGVAP